MLSSHISQSDDIELQAIQETKDDSMALVTDQKNTLDPDECFQGYWNHLQRYLFSNKANVIDLYKACEYLLKSAALGNDNAQSSMRISQKSFLAHEFKKALDAEFSLRLEEHNSDSENYFTAQSSLFILHYTKKYSKIYSKYTERYAEIYEALERIKNADQYLNPSLIDFAQQFVEGYPDNITYESLKSSAWKILINEILGDDPLLQGKDVPRPGSVYPFRIISRERFREEISQAIMCSPAFLNEAILQYENYLQKNTRRIPCQKSRAGTYSISISAEELKNCTESIIYFVDENNNEVGRFEILDNAIDFKGHGNKIKLNVTGEINCSSFIIENIGGSVILNADFNLDQPLYFSSRADNVVLNTEIYSDQEVKFDVHGGIEFANRSSLFSYGPINLQADSLVIDGHIESNSYIQSKTHGQTTITHQASCHAQSDVVISAQVFKELSGRVTSDANVVISATDGVNIRGGAFLEGKESISFKAKSLITTNKASIGSAGAAKFDIQELLVIDKQSELKADSIQIKAKNVKNYSPHVTASKIMVNCDEVVENHPSGVFTTTELLQFTGGSVWNGGKLKFGNRMDIKLNKVFVHGVVSLSTSDLMDAMKNSSMEGDSVNIVAGVVFGALGTSYVRSKTISAIMELGSDFTCAKYNRKSRLIALECSVDLPNLAIIYKDLNDFCVKAQSGDYSSVLSSIFSYETMTNTLTVLRWIVRTLAPGAGKLTDIVWNSLILITSLPSLFSQCYELYQKSQLGETIEYYDLYKLIAAAGGIGTQAFNLENQVELGVSDGFKGDFSLSNMTNNIPALGLNLASLFLPSNSDESLIGVSTGVSANAAITRRNLFSYQAWQTEIGVNISHSFGNAVQHNQVTFGTNVSNIGYGLSRSGYESASNDVTNVDSLTESSTVEATNVSWSARDLVEKANVHATNIQAKGTRSLLHSGDFTAVKSVQLSASSLVASSESHTSAENVSLTGDRVTNGGTAEAKHFTVIATQYAESTETAHTKADTFYESGKVVKENGHITVTNSDQPPEVKLIDPATTPPEDKQAANADKPDDHKPTDKEADSTDHTSDAPADNSSENPSDKADETKKDEQKPIDARVIIHGDESATLGDKSSIDAGKADIVVSADQVTAAGEAHAKAAYLIGKESVTLAATGQSFVNKIFASAKDVTQNSQITILNNPPEAPSESTGSTPTAEEKSPTDKALNPNVILKSENNTSIGEKSTIKGVDAVLYAKGNNVTNAGTAEVKAVVFEATNKAELTATAYTKSESLFVHAADVTQKSTIEITNKPHIETPKNSDAPADEKGNDKPAEDAGDPADVSLIADNNLEVAATSNLKGQNATAYFKGKNIHDAGTKDVSHVIEKATDSLKTEATENTTANSIIIDADKSADLAGKMAIRDHAPEEKSDEKKPSDPKIVVHSKNVKLEKSSDISAKDDTVVIDAEEISDGGTTRAATLVEHATGHLETELSAVHHASVISLQANTAALNGIEDAKEVVLAIDHGLDVNAILASQGQGSNIRPGEHLAIQTKDAFAFNQDMNLGVAVSLTAASVSANSKSIHDTKSLELRSTDGGISFLNSRIRSDMTLALQSAQGLSNVHSDVWADILSIHTYGDIYNFAAGLGATTYLQAISDYGTLLNVGELQINPYNPSLAPIYNASVIQGGTGNGFDGVGMYLKTGGKIINKGSVIRSTGSLYEFGVQGVENIADHYSYTTPGVPLPKLPASPTIKDLMLYMGAAQFALPPTVVNAVVGAQTSSNNGVYIISENGNFLNSQSRVLGNETYINTGRGKITNIAGLVQGMKYLELVAGGNIENLCMVSDVKGQYDTLKAYDIGHFIGGTGEGHDGIGLLARSDSQFINDASEVSSVGSNVISGRLGISSRARYNEYTSYYKHTKEWYGRETTTVDRSFQLQSALIYSANGSNTFISELGGIDSCSTNFISAQDNIFSAKGPVDLYGYVLSEREYKDKSNLWKLTDHKTTRVDEVAVPTIIANPGNISILSLSDVAILNASLNASGKISVLARDITLSAPTLNHSLVEESRGFGFNAPALRMTNATPLYGDYKALAGSQCAAEWAANGWNMAFDGVNSVNSVISGIRSGSLGQTLFPASYLTGVEMNYTRTKSTTNWQTVAPGAFLSCGSLDMKATNSITFGNGVPVYVAGDANINTRIFSQVGAGLNSSLVSASQGVSVGLSLQSNPNFGASISGSVTRSRNYANQVFQVGGVLNLNADQWNMTDANLLAGALNAHVDTLSIASNVNTSSGHSWAVSLNTNGNFSCQNANNRSALIGTASGISVANGMNLAAAKIYLEGGKIVSGGDSYILADLVQSKAVKQYNEGSSFGISGNAHDLFNFQPIPQWQQSIPSVGVSVGGQNYKASQAGTIFIPNSNGLQVRTVEGQLNTANSNGLQVDHNDHYDVTVKVPIFSSTGLKQMQDNFAWAKNKLSPPNIHPVPQMVPHAAKPHLPKEIDSDDKSESDSSVDARKSRLERWQKKGFDGLAGEENASKWAKVFSTAESDVIDDSDSESARINPSSTEDDVPPLEDTEKSSWNIMNRVLGASQALEGALEAALGFAGGVATVETGLGPVLGAFLYERGVDNFGTGLDILLNGSSKRTQLANILLNSGLSDEGTSIVENTIDLFAPVGIAKVVGYGRFFIDSSVSFLGSNKFSNFKFIGKFDAYAPGVLPNKMASTFIGQKYSTFILENDTRMFRVGTESIPLGEFYTFDMPASEIQMRIDKAILPRWPEGGSSTINTGYEVLIPKGTIIHAGEVASQGEIFLGGTPQLFIKKPWRIPDVKILNKFPLKEELLWNLQARR
ncbi:MAG: hypothetical protein P4L31_04835 [Candidatus Babeliales bacterium]|nr:hypothetical protein [Candidatus Babeliales bacterium]